MSKRVLIVGAFGFLGTHLQQVLQRNQGTILLTMGRGLKSAMSFNDIETLKRSEPRIDVIYILAAHIPYGHFNVPDKFLVSTNVQLVLELSLAYPDSKIVFASSVSVYGTPLQTPLKINSPFNDPDLYGLSKLAGESIVSNHKRYAIIRFTSLIGAKMKPVSMIPKMVESARSIGEITVLGNGKRSQNYVDIRDAASMCTAAENAEINIKVLGVGDRSYTNLEVASIIQGFTGAEIKFKGEDSSPSFEYDFEESYKALNFKPAYSLQQSISEMINL
jgi:UDP-glucose 4-epimerase